MTTFYDNVDAFHTSLAAYEVRREVSETGQWMLFVGRTAHGYNVIVCGDRKPRVKQMWRSTFLPSKRDDIRVRVGCRWFSLKQAKRHWGRMARSRWYKHANETLALIDIGLRDASTRHYCRAGIKMKDVKI